MKVCPWRLYAINSGMFCRPISKAVSPYHAQAPKGVSSKTLGEQSHKFQSLAAKYTKKAKAAQPQGTQPADEVGSLTQDEISTAQAEIDRLTASLLQEIASRSPAAVESYELICNKLDVTYDQIVKQHHHYRSVCNKLMSQESDKASKLLFSKLRFHSHSPAALRV